ncbi:DUF7453 family protein [Botrimarina mediterranea]|uniref:PEP-CTERM protein-sorting domain-containing protein n=1 Tax=Botrimarina mediterranea TaxID=2528022 RepID=A0A518KEW9_9BACT|nr:choice-of-anchor tandem repeat NxxGxxAF-containing protein [Botrimarina mediterranea]QDV76344.1 hypothetical protein Spa11_45740 [Botrimarina mediterranea]QDV80942.1 hypothetical protein K2D_45770 [Planctomycetes bacterium K2D]
MSTVANSRRLIGSSVVWCLLVSGVLASGDLRAIALSGVAPGGNNAAYTGLGTPVINARGDVAFLGSATDGTEQMAGVWTARDGEPPSPAALIGQIAPGANKPFQSLRGPSIDRFGRVAYIASLQRDEGETIPISGAWRAGPDGDVTLIALAREDWFIPGTSSVIGHFDTTLFVNAAGQAMFSTSLRTDSLWDGTVIVGENAGVDSVLGIVAREGQSAPGTDAAFRFVYYRHTGPSNAGHVGIVTTLQGPNVTPDNEEGVWAYTPGAGIRLVAREGDAAPAMDGVFNSFYYPRVSVNRFGDVAFAADYRPNEGGASVGSGVFSSAAGTEGPVAIVKTGDAISSMGLQFGSAGNVLLLGSTGDIVAPVTLSGSGVNTANNHAILMADAGGDLNLIAREGDPAPGTDARFGNMISPDPFFSPSLNGRGQVVFSSRLSGTGVDASNDSAIWAYDGGALRLIAREGDSIDVSDDPHSPDLRTIESLDAELRSSNDDGLPSGFNDRGQIAFYAAFTDGTSGVFVSDAVAAPLPLAGDYDRDGFVTPGDYDVWESAYGSWAVSYEGADGNGDGFVDAADYAVWRDAYQTVVQSVPEPSGLSGLAVALAAAAFRRRR